MDVCSKRFTSLHAGTKASAAPRTHAPTRSRHWLTPDVGPQPSATQVGQAPCYPDQSYDLHRLAYANRSARESLGPQRQ